MFKFTRLWKKPEQTAPLTKTETMSKFLLNINEAFKVFLNQYSWFVYFIAGLLFLCCIYYYIYDSKRRLDLRRRRENLQRPNERISQRRRPGAVHRNHEIIRNALKTVHQYIRPNVMQDSKAKSYVLKRTRSGVIYGSFSVNEET